MIYDEMSLTLCAHMHISCFYFYFALCMRIKYNNNRIVRNVQREKKCKTLFNQFPFDIHKNRRRFMQNGVRFTHVFRLDLSSVCAREI